MPTAIAMPKLGMTMREGTVLEWRISLGDAVEKGQVILEIESEKSAVEIEATASGVLRHIYVGPDETVPCGALLAALTESGDEPFDAAAFAAEHARTLQPAARRPAAPAASVSAPLERAGARGAATPAARRLARELGIDVAGITGSGPGGRITREDVEAHAAIRESLTPVAEGIALEVLSQGEGDPVLLLPGFGTDVSVFAPQVPALAERHRVLGINPRGVGSSDAPDLECYDVAQSAADAARIAEQPAHVIGASLGAAVALELALAHPDRVRSLVLVTPFVEAAPRLLAVLQTWGQLAEEVGSLALARALVPWLFAPATLAEPRAVERVTRGLADTLGRVPAKTLARTARGLRAWSGSRVQDLKRIAVPTLVIAGAEDLLTPDAAALAREIPEAECLVIPNTGHAVGLEAANAVNPAILAHLARS